MEPLDASFKARAKKFKSLLKTTSGEPSADNVHDLRVAARRLRANFWLMPKAENSGRIGKARRDLKRLCRELGKQRTYDVALADAISFGLATKNLQRRQIAAQAKTRKALSGEKRKAMVSRLDRAIKEAGVVSPPRFRPRIELLREELGKASHRKPKGDQQRHRLRIDLRKARYLIEVFHHEVPQLIALQDRLGRWHDLTVLSELVGSTETLAAARKKEQRRAERILGVTLNKTENALRRIANQL